MKSTQVLDIPTSLLIAALFVLIRLCAGIAVAPRRKWFVHQYQLADRLAGLFVGAYTASVRREAVPLFLGLLAMENAALFAGFAIAPELPMMAESPWSSTCWSSVFVFGILTRAVHEHIGTTEVGALTLLKEESQP